MASDLSIIGTPQPKIDGIEKVTGSATFATDIIRPGMLHARMKRSPHAHARVLGVDTSKAMALQGVKAVLTIDDVPRVRHAGAPAPRTESLAEDQFIFDEIVRFLGDGVAAVAAENEETLEEALALIKVEYEVLPAVFDVNSALEPDAPQIHESGNELIDPALLIEQGDIDKGFDEADYVIEQNYSTGRPSHCYMEPNVCVCKFSADNKLTIWSSTQGAFMVRGILSEVLGIPVNKIQVIVEHMGGGFGGKQDLYQHEFICALLAQKTGHTVKMEYTREECFVAGKSRHPVDIKMKHGFKQDGTLTAREVLYVSNTGAYASHGRGITAVGCHDITSLYRCDNLRIEGHSVYTNSPIAGAFRGYGAVQSYFALDCQMDEIAEMLGMDPVEFRIQNAVGDGDQGPSGYPILGNSLASCLRYGAEEVGWFERHQKTKQDGSGRFKRGWGVGTEMHTSGASPDIKEQSNAILKMNEDGTIHLLTGVADLGTGAHTVMAQIAAEELGIAVEDVRVITGDTDVMPFDNGAYASRTTFVGGGAVSRAANKIKKDLLRMAAVQLDVETSELDLANGSVFVKTDPSQFVPLKDLVQGHEGGIPPRTLIEQGSYEPGTDYSFAAHFVEVEVDTETGKVEVKQVVAVHEIGKAINRIGVEGQIEGGIQQRIGHSLIEDLLLDPKTCRILNASFVDYKMPLAMDMPPIKTIILEENPSPEGPFGAKGVGEDPILPIGPAIANAVYDALGIRFRTLPITPEMVLKALEEDG